MADQTIVDPTTGEIVPKYKDGLEQMDPNPIAETLKFKREPSYFEQMRAQIRQELSRAAEDQGFETFDEANDFAIGEDYEPLSAYEAEYGPDGLDQFERLEQALIDTPLLDAPQTGAGGAAKRSQKGAEPPAEPPAEQNPGSDPENG